MWLGEGEKKKLQRSELNQRHCDYTVCVYTRSPQFIVLVVKNLKNVFHIVASSAHCTDAFKAYFVRHIDIMRVSMKYATKQCRRIKNPHPDMSAFDSDPELSIINLKHLLV